MVVCVSVCQSDYLNVLTYLKYRLSYFILKPKNILRQRSCKRRATTNSLSKRKQHFVFNMVATSTLKSKNGESCISDVSERRYHHDTACIDKELDFWDRCLAESHLNVDLNEDRTCQQLAKMFENCLSRAKKTTLNCSSVLVPEKLTRRIARDVLRLAFSEPCGLRGCILYVNLECEKGCRRLERIVYDTSVVPTFELTLVFKQDGSAWPSLREFLFMGTCFSPGFKHVLKLSPGFRLVKKKLYSSASAGTVVEEC